MDGGIVFGIIAFNKFLLILFHDIIPLCFDQIKNIKDYFNLSTLIEDKDQ
jgi:hypothetical protein